MQSERDSSLLRCQRHHKSSVPRFGAPCGRASCRRPPRNPGRGVFDGGIPARRRRRPQSLTPIARWRRQEWGGRQVARRDDSGRIAVRMDRHRCPDPGQRRRKAAECRRPPAAITAPPSRAARASASAIPSTTCRASGVRSTERTDKAPAHIPQGLDAFHPFGELDDPAAYSRWVLRFLAWCEARDVELARITPGIADGLHRGARARDGQPAARPGGAPEILRPPRHPPRRPPQSLPVRAQPAALHPRRQDPVGGRLHGCRDAVDRLYGNVRAGGPGKSPPPPPPPPPLTRSPIRSVGCRRGSR